MASVTSRLKHLFAGLKPPTAVFSLWPEATASLQVMTAPFPETLNDFSEQSPLAKPQWVRNMNKK